jgi:hypothetical protein
VDDRVGDSVKSPFCFSVVAIWPLTRQPGSDNLPLRGRGQHLLLIFFHYSFFEEKCIETNLIMPCPAAGKCGKRDNSKEMFR